MDTRFLKIISESYVLDNPTINITEEQIYNELSYISKTLQTYDPELYDELYETEKVRLQQILKRHIDYICESSGLIVLPENFTEDFDDVIEESMPEIIGNFILSHPASVTAVIAAIVTLTRKPLSKFTFKTLSTIGKGIASLGSFLTRQGKYLSLRYAVIQENFKKCYVKCNLTDMKDLNVLTYISMKEGAAHTSANARKQALCLRDCFLENLIDVIALHMENYFACLKKTGGSSAISNTDSDDIMRMISSTNIATSCEEFYKASKSALTTFYTLLDLVFEPNVHDDEKLKWVNQLRTRVYESRQSVLRSGSSPDRQQQHLQKYSK